MTTYLQVQWYLDTYRNQAEILNAISQMGFSGGSTHTELALQSIGRDVLVIEHGDRPSVRNVVIVITDGQSTNEVETIRAAMDLKMNGTEIISIGIGSSKALLFCLNLILLDKWNKVNKSIIKP